MRLQLALNVKDLDQAVEFYSKMFGAEVNKRKPGYANFAIDEPPLKLVLFELPDAPERLNHLGVEVFEDEEVDSATERLRAAGSRQLSPLQRRAWGDETAYFTDPDGNVLAVARSAPAG